MGSPGHHGQPRLLSTVGELLLRRRRLRRRRPTPACGSLLSVARVPPLPESTWSAWRAGLHRQATMHCFEVCTHFAPLALHQLACARLGFSGPARGNDSRGLRGPRARCRSAGCARAASGGPSRGRRGCLSAAGTMSQMRGNARAPRRAKSRAPGGASSAAAASPGALAAPGRFLLENLGWPSAPAQRSRREFPPRARPGRGARAARLARRNGQPAREAGPRRCPLATAGRGCAAPETSGKFTPSP